MNSDKGMAPHPNLGFYIPPALVAEQLRNDHLNECHPEPHYHPGCPLCEEEGRLPVESEVV